MTKLPTLIMTAALTASAWAQGRGAARTFDPVRTEQVDCARGQTITAVLAALQYWPAPIVIELSGTCHEQVVLNRDNVELVGATAADGVSWETTGNAILIAGFRRVTLAHMTINGGGEGVLVQRGGVVTISDATLQAGAQDNLNVGPGGSANVANSVLQDGAVMGMRVNSGGEAELSGVIVQNNSFHGIFVNGGDFTAQATTITGNGTRGSGSGIFVWHGGRVQVQQSTISNNPQGYGCQTGGVGAFSGVSISNNSQGGLGLYFGCSLDLGAGSNGASSMLIENNGGDAITASGGSSVNVGNATTISGNRGNGIHLSDTSVLGTFDTTGITIAGNSGWGVICDGPPAAAQITQGAGGPSVNATMVSGNAAGQIQCPGIHVP